MGRLDRFFQHFRGLTFSKGIPNVPRGPAKSLESGHRLLAPALGLLLSVLLGIWAHQSSQAEALRTWESENLPSPRIWTFALGSLEFHALSDPRKIQKASKGLPSLLEEPGSVWITEDSRWIAVFLPTDSSAPIRIFCIECEPRKPASWPTSWQPLGRSWKGFEEAMNRAKMVQRAPKSSLPAKKAIYRDPREVRY